MGRNITTRLGASTIAVVALLGLTWLGAVVSADRLRASYTHTVTTIDALSSLVLQGANLRDDEETSLRGYLLTGQPDFLQPYATGRRAIPALRRRQDLLTAAEPDARPLLTAQRRAGDAWGLWATHVLRQPLASPRGSAALVAQQRAGKILFDRYRAATDRIIAALDADRARDLRQSVRMLAGINRFFAVLFAGAIGLGLLLGWQATRAVTRPLAALRQAAQAIGRGDLTRPVAAEGSREFVELAVSMEWMRQRLHTRDVELSAAQRALRASEERYRALAEHGSDLVNILAVDGAILYESPSYGRVLGASLSDLYHAYGGALGMLHPDDRARVRATFAACARDGAPGVRLTFRHRHADGSWRTLDCVATNRLVDPAVRGIVSTLRDVTERMRAEDALARSKEELERSNAELQQFAYVASHDLQEPLRTISSYLGLLKRRYRGKLDENADEFIDYAVDGATRMSRLIQDVLAYSRVGTRPREVAPVDCASLMAAATANLQARIAETGARVTYGALPTVRGDEAQLGQLFQNLIGNALKFCREAPEVTIEAERRGDSWELSVRDNGIGIAPDQTERIFQVFQRLHTRSEYEGTGIGLAICKRIVERHGGRIWVESTPGQGATFRFTLPAVDDHTGAHNRAEETAA